VSDPADQYKQLTILAQQHTTEIEFDDWLWASLYDYAEGDQAPQPDQIAEITGLWAISPEGWGSTDIALIGRLADGRWVTCVAWSDTSGFGCRQSVDWRINDTREAAIAFGLDQESRSHLGLQLTNDANRPA
jgi:hypothetical protein